MLQKLFSSRVRVALLTYLFSHPDEQFYARELARHLGEHYNAVWRELNNLQDLGLLASEESAGVKFYRLNSGFSIYEELRRIILKTTGLGQVLRQEVGRLGAVEWAFVFVSNQEPEQALGFAEAFVGQLVDLITGQPRT